MDDASRLSPPAALAGIERDTESLGFAFASEARTGAFLRTLAASRPGGRLLELGTGTGIGTAWLLDGMDAESTILTVDTDAALGEVARKHLGGDSRVTFRIAPGEEVLAELEPASFGLIFADAFPGKFTHLDLALGLLKPGGLHVVDDLLPQASWPEGDELKARFVEELDARDDLVLAKLAWSTGLIVAVRKA